jgi:leucyl/phenylalanyl-tRNA---protein transferase
MSRHHESALITPEILLRAYAAGIFPMSEGADDPGLFWVEPKERGIIPLDGFHVSRKLRALVRRDHFEVRVDTVFDQVIAACAGGGDDRPDTWINGRIRNLFCELFDTGRAHSIECWRDGRLVGGLYGLAVNGAFFGESMFHRETDASKVALVHLVGRLRAGGFLLLDAQFQTDHLAQFGTVEIARKAYRVMLEKAMNSPAEWNAIQAGGIPKGADIIAALGPAQGVSTQG